MSDGTCENVKTLRVCVPQSLWPCYNSMGKGFRQIRQYWEIFRACDDAQGKILGKILNFYKLFVYNIHYNIFLPMKTCSTKNSRKRKCEACFHLFHFRKRVMCFQYSIYFHRFNLFQLVSNGKIFLLMFTSLIHTSWKNRFIYHP